MPITPLFVTTISHKYLMTWYITECVSEEVADCAYERWYVADRASCLMFEDITECEIEPTRTGLRVVIYPRTLVCAAEVEQWEAERSST